MSLGLILVIILIIFLLGGFSGRFGGYGYGYGHGGVGLNRHDSDHHCHFDADRADLGHGYWSNSGQLLAENL